MQTRLIALMTGTPAPFGPAGEPSTMGRRRQVTAPVLLGSLGFTGDKVADDRFHGGADKALHHYAHEHYAWWRAHLGEHPRLDVPGAFGENISTEGLVETDVRIGDRFRLGDALIELSHGRQPCWKLDHYFGVRGRDSVAATIIRSGKCGFYYRVLEQGLVTPGAAMVLVERGNAEWTVDRVFRLLVGGGHKADLAAVRALAGLEPLAMAWRERAVALAAFAGGA